MEEKIGDFHSFRKNLIIVSIISLCVIIFAEDKIVINLFGLIKVTDINSLKIMTLLLILNLYALIRYNQYLLKIDKDINQKILVIDIINDALFNKNIISVKVERFNESGAVEKILYRYKKDEVLNLRYDGLILLGTNISTRFLCMNALANDNIIGGCFNNIKINGNNVIEVFLKNKDIKTLDDNISITYSLNNFRLFIIKLKFYIKEHFFSDYYLPVFIGIIGIEVLFIKITYLILK